MQKPQSIKIWLTPSEEDCADKIRGFDDVMKLKSYKKKYVQLALETISLLMKSLRCYDAMINLEVWEVNSSFCFFLPRTVLTHSQVNQTY